MEDYLGTGDQRQAPSRGFTLRDSGQSTHNFLEDMKRFMSGTQGVANSGPGVDRVGNNVVIGVGQDSDFGICRSTLELRFCFVDFRFFVALGKSYIKSIGLHVSALNKDHNVFVSSNWAEGKDLYEMEERRVIARLLDDLSEGYCNKYRLVLCSFSNYLVLSILMSKLKDRVDLQDKLRAVFSGGVVDFATILSWRDEFHKARAALALHGASTERLVCQVAGGRSRRVVEQLDPEKSAPQSTARLLASLVRRLLPAAQEQSQDSQNMIVTCAANFAALKKRDPVDVCLKDRASIRAVAGWTHTHHVDTRLPENAWLESPEFATFFSRIDLATQGNAKLSSISWDPNDKILKLSIANRRKDVHTVPLSQGLKLGSLAPSLTSKFVYSSTLSHLFKPQTVVSLASAPNLGGQIVLPAFMQCGDSQYMTCGSLVPRKEIDLETGHNLSEDWTTEIIFLSAKTKNTPGMYKTPFTQVNFLNLLTDKETFLVYLGDKYLKSGKGIPNQRPYPHMGMAYVHMDTQKFMPVLPKPGPVTHSTYENVCEYMLSYMGDDPAKKKIFICYNLPKYLGYFKHFFQRVESQIFGFVDLEWCLGVETPDHLVSWLQMINVKVRVPAEPAESDTISKFSGRLLRPLLAKDVEGFVRRYVVSYKDAMKLTTEKHLKARPNTGAGDDDDVVEVAEDNDIHERIQDNLRKKDHPDNDSRDGKNARKRIRKTLERLNARGFEPPATDDDRWPVLVNVKAAKSSADGGHFLSELEVMAGHLEKDKPEVFSLGKGKTVSGRAALTAKELIKYLQRESNIRHGVRLVMVFVSSQMAGLFIHFIRSVPDAWESFTAVCDCWIDLSAACYNYQTSLWTPSEEGKKPNASGPFKALHNPANDGLLLSRLRKFVLGSGQWHEIYIPVSASSGEQNCLFSMIHLSLTMVTTKQRFLIEISVFLNSYYIF